VTEALKELCEAAASTSLCHRPGADDAGLLGADAPFAIKTTVSLNSIMIDGTGCAAAAASRSTARLNTLRRRARIRRHQVDFRQMATD